MSPSDLELKGKQGDNGSCGKRRARPGSEKTRVWARQSPHLVKGRSKAPSGADPERTECRKCHRSLEGPMELHSLASSSPGVFPPLTQTLGAHPATPLHDANAPLSALERQFGHAPTRRKRASPNPGRLSAVARVSEPPEEGLLSRRLEHGAAAEAGVGLQLRQGHGPLGGRVH